MVAPGKSRLAGRHVHYVHCLYMSVHVSMLLITSTCESDVRVVVGQPCFHVVPVHILCCHTHTHRRLVGPLSICMLNVQRYTHIHMYIHTCIILHNTCCGAMNSGILVFCMCVHFECANTVFSTKGVPIVRVFKSAFVQVVLNWVHRFQDEGLW